MSTPGIRRAPSLDAALRRAAATAPRRAALRFGSGTMSYGELDAAVDGFAAALTDLAPGGVVGVTAALHPAFPIAYFGAIRAGAVCAVIEPGLAEDDLDRVLALAGVEVLVASADMAGLLRRIVLDPSGPSEVVYLDRPGEHGAMTVARLAQAHASGPRQGPSAPDDVACLRFSLESPGQPRVIRLTHRNLVVGAAQAARAYGFGPGSTVVTHLPAYEPVYLDAAVHAGATQVLCTDPDPDGGVALAGRESATHYCGPATGLARLAADPRRTDRRLPTVRALLSGGSAHGNGLAPAAAARLRERVGVPLVQWYGPAEAPLTHCDRVEHPTAGSVGRPVLGTYCRVVDLDGLRPVPPGSPGQVRVRGPQVASGSADADGWLGTGVLGYVDREGALFLVGRIGDDSRPARAVRSASPVGVPA